MFNKSIILIIGLRPAGRKGRQVVLLGLVGGAELRLIHSYGFLLCGDPGDSCPEDVLREAGSIAGGCPVNSGGLNPKVGPTEPGTVDAGGPPAAAAAAAAA